MNPAKRHEIFSRLREANPNPTTELNYSSPFELLIAVLLSAQATDVGVNKATGPLFAAANTPQAIYDLGVAGLKEYIKTIGLFNTKAENAIKTCKILVDEYDSQVPENREAPEALPGVGRKTANVVLNTAFGHPTIAVDTHIYRVSNRTKVAPGKTVRQVEDKLIKVVPDEFKVDVHHWLILHGRYVCIARKPRCGSCTIDDLCEFKDKTDEIVRSVLDPDGLRALRMELRLYKSRYGEIRDNLTTRQLLDASRERNKSQALVPWEATPEALGEVPPDQLF